MRVTQGGTQMQISQHNREKDLAADILVLVNEIHAYAVEYYYAPKKCDLKSLQLIKQSLVSVKELFIPLSQ